MTTFLFFFISQPKQARFHLTSDTSSHHARGLFLHTYTWFTLCSRPGFVQQDTENQMCSDVGGCLSCPPECLIKSSQFLTHTHTLCPLLSSLRRVSVVYPICLVKTFRISAVEIPVQEVRGTFFHSSCTVSR